MTVSGDVFFSKLPNSNYHSAKQTTALSFRKNFRKKFYAESYTYEKLNLVCSSTFRYETFKVFKTLKVWSGSKTGFRFSVQHSG